MSKVVLSFSYNGSHKKNTVANENYITEIDPIVHMQMLIAAIDYVNPNGKYDVILSAINFDIWNLSKEQRLYGLEIYKRARFVFNWPFKSPHHTGSAKSILMSLEGSVSINADFMIHLAEDIAMEPETVDYFVQHLSDVDYVGSHWHIKKQESQFLNSQVFGCRPLAFLKHKIIPEHTNSLERDIMTNIKNSGLRYKVGELDYPCYFPERRTLPHGDHRKFGKPLYEHTHDPEKFRKLVENKGVKWPKLHKIKMFS